MNMFGCMLHLSVYMYVQTVRALLTVEAIHICLGRQCRHSSNWNVSHSVFILFMHLMPFEPCHEKTVFNFDKLGTEGS